MRLLISISGPGHEADSQYSWNDIRTVEFLVIGRSRSRYMQINLVIGAEKPSQVNLLDCCGAPPTTRHLAEQIAEYMEIPFCHHDLDT